MCRKFPAEAEPRWWKPKAQRGPQASPPLRRVTLFKACKPLEPSLSAARITTKGRMKYHRPSIID